MRSCCFVPRCSTGYRSEYRKNKRSGNKNKSLFKAPKDLDLLEKWQRAIGRTDKKLEAKDVVCERHFLSSDIIRYYETKLPDGTTDKILRGKPKLQDNAVPCIFPNVKKIKKQKSKPPRQKKKVTDLNEQEHLQDIEVIIVVPEDEPTVHDESVETAEDSFFKQIKNHLDRIPLPSTHWTGAFVEGLNVIIFSEWDSTYTGMKKVIVERDLSIKVLFGHVEIKGNNIKENITTLDELVDILQTVHVLVLCQGVKLRSISDSCRGIALKRRVGRRGVIANKCMPCLQFEK